jgi:hypothetical protein
LGYDLVTSKDDDTREAKFRAEQDKLESLTRASVVGLSSALSTLSGLFAGYVKNLELDLEPLFAPLLEQTDDELLKVSIATRHAVTTRLDEAQSDLASSLEPEKFVGGIQEIQRRAESLFAEQSARARRMRMAATVGVIIVGLGAVAQLVDVLLQA